MVNEKKFGLAIIGGGPGGYTAAIRAAQLGMSVGLIEKDLLGGTCLNRGCIPTKALGQSARVCEISRTGKTFGVTAGDVACDWSGMQRFKNRCVLKLRKGVESLMAKNKIEVISGHGRLKDAETIDVDGADVRAENIILAMGSHARSLPSLPVDGDKIITSDHALSLDELPQRLLIVGAGGIGCEFGYIMSAMGVEVTMVEFLDHAIPMEDEEISIEFEASLKRRKTELHTRCSVESVVAGESGVVATVKPRDGGDEFEIEADKVLVSVGRGPSTDDCGLDVVGIPVEKGFIQVDEFLNTGVGNIKAIGDAIGGMMLAHKASAEGILAVETIAGLDRQPLAAENIPRASYTNPEIGSVGLNEAQARELYGDSIRIGKFPFSASGKAVVNGETTGFVRLISAGENRRLVGAQAIGSHATDIISIAATAIGLGATADSFAHIVQAHPTLAEVWHEAAHALIDGPINF